MVNKESDQSFNGPIDILLESYRREVSTGLNIFYYLIQYEEDRIKEYSFVISKNPYFWLNFKILCQTKLFICLRNLFNFQKDCFGYQFFINSCKENIKEFSKEKLIERKKKAGLTDDRELSIYMEKVYIPNLTDFDELSRFIRKESKTMQNGYTNASTQIFAHNIISKPDDINDKLIELNYADIEKALLSAWHVYIQVLNLYLNGHKPEPHAIIG